MGKRRNGWHELLDGARYVLARDWPPRFDVVACAAFPKVRPSRLAHQVRQDLWRAMKHLRGFSPVLQIVTEDEGLMLWAGGRVLRPTPSDTAERIQVLLDNPVHRARWVQWAQCPPGRGIGL